MPDEPAKPAENPVVLDQAAIDQLLAQETAPKKAVFHADGTLGDGTTAPKVEPYDFRTPVFLTEIELRRLRLLHEDFIRYLAARLSLFLRMEVGLKMSKLTTLTYFKFTDSIPNPTHLCLFKIDPLHGVGILDVNPRLALTIADRMLGGRGHSVKTERYLTEIEIALLEDVVGMILQEWCTPWKNEMELRPSIIGHENNGRFLQTSPKDAVVLALSIEASLGDCSEQIQIGLPYYTIEPLVRKMQARRQKDTTSADVVTKRVSWQPVFDHITVPVRAEWEVFRTSLREVASLRVGDVIEFPPTLIDNARILLNGIPKFVGKVGLDSDHVTVQVTRNLPTPDQHANPIG